MNHFEVLSPVPVVRELVQCRCYNSSIHQQQKHNHLALKTPLGLLKQFVRRAKSMFLLFIFVSAGLQFTHCTLVYDPLSDLAKNVLAVWFKVCVS